MTESITRLHISPLSPALLDSILAPSIRPLATNISFHNIPTFPENDYGFVSLPTMEADKVKKKLNGSILKGKKFKVDVAKPDPKEMKRAVGGDDNKIEKTSSSTKPEKPKSTKRKADDSVLDGYEIPGDRNVKRGWTEPASAKKFKKQNKSDKEARKGKLQSKSKYTEKPECLFKMRTPPNKTADAIAASKKTTKSKKSKAPNEVVVHEFAQTITTPSFLKSTTGGKPVTAAFEEGKGWVDEEGNVEENGSNKKSKTAEYHPGKRDGAKERAVAKEKNRVKTVNGEKKSPSSAETSLSDAEAGQGEDSDWTSPSGSSDSESNVSESDTNSDTDSDSDTDASPSGETPSSSLSEKKANMADNQAEKSALTRKAISESNVSEAEAKESTGEDSDESDESDGDGNIKDNDSEREVSSMTNQKNIPVSPDPSVSAIEAKEVHPLEALFKRTHSDENISQEANKTFSFFAGNEDDIEGEEEGILEPMTPFSKRDRQTRGLRSGAPTPDTAVFRRHKNISPLDREEDEDDSDDEDTDMDDVDNDSDRAQQTLDDATPTKSRGQTSSQQQTEETDFAKWFWEHRGENNRAWKRRRREAAKERRQRENRRKGLKGRG